MDELQRGVHEQMLNKKRIERNTEMNGREYAERVNGVLGEMEKNSALRSFDGRGSRQGDIKKGFVDEDIRKLEKIYSHVNRNLDTDIFNHSSDRYQ